MCQIKQIRLLGSFRHLDLEFIAGMTKLDLDAAPNRAEPRYQLAEYGEHHEVGKIGSRDEERVQRLREEVVEAYG